MPSPPSLLDEPQGSADPGSITLEFSQFGPLAEGRVSTKPLTLFVGENNSGKSWVASLVWGFYKGFSKSFRQPGHPAWDAAHDQLAKLLADGPASPSKSNWVDDPATTEAPDSFPRLGSTWRGWAQALAPSAEKTLLRRIHPQVGEAAAFRCVNAPPRADVVVWREDPSDYGGTEATPHQIFWTWVSAATKGAGWHVAGRGGVGAPVGHGRLAEELLAWFAGSPTPPSYPVHARYFPASRSAYLHLLPALASVSVRHAWGGAGDSGSRGERSRAGNINLTEPQRDFIDFLLADAGRGEGCAADLADLLEGEVLRGRLSRDEDSAGRFSFAPLGGPRAFGCKPPHPS